MSIVDLTGESGHCEESVPLPPNHSAHQPLHRLAEVRRQQGMSRRSVARQMGTDMQSVREQEEDTADLRISELMRWQEVLEVPLADLLVDPGTALSRPVMERAQMVKLMKTAAAIQQRASTPAIRRMAQTLIDQLVEIMPELKEVSPWHSVGQRRGLDELGRVMDRRISDDMLHGHLPHE